MVRLLAALVVGGLLAVCAAPAAQPTPTPSPSPTPGATPTPEDQIVMTAELRPSAAVTGPEASAMGEVTVAFVLVRGAGGAITSATATFEFSVSGMPEGSAINIAHIHRGGEGQDGPVVVDTGLRPGMVTLTAGAATFASAAVSVDGDLAQEIIDSPGSFYFNVHSALNPGGVIRGQLVRR